MRLEPKLSGGSIQIDLRGIQEGTHPLVLEGEGQVLPLEGESETKFRDYHLDGELTLTFEDCRVRGFLSGILDTVCDRCLTRLELGVDSQLDAAVTESSSEAGHGNSEGAPAESPIHSSVVDVTSVIREALVLEIPFKSLCREDCRGLCPRCGKNRNEESCDCDLTSRDPRWSALEGLSFPSDPEE